MSRSVWITIGVGVAVLVMLVGMCARPLHKSEVRECRNSLHRIGELLLARRDAGSLTPLAGRAFLLQVKKDLAEAERGILVCPADSLGAVCSYAGPDLQTARAFVKGTLEQPAILACDRECFHFFGITVLWSTGKVEFLLWPDIQGANGDVVEVGPDAPDPRFRHLVK